MAQLSRSLCVVLNCSIYIYIYLYSAVCVAYTIICSVCVASRMYSCIALLANCSIYNCSCNTNHMGNLFKWVYDKLLFLCLNVSNIAHLECKLLLGGYSSRYTLTFVHNAMILLVLWAFCRYLFFCESYILTCRARLRVSSNQIYWNSSEGLNW